MSIEVARNNPYAHLGKAWLRHQSARILQRHLQYGQHCRLDLDALLAAAAGTMASRHLNKRVANECFRQATIDAIDFCSRLETCDQRQIAGSPGGDSALDVRTFAIAWNAVQRRGVQINAGTFLGTPSERAGKLVNPSPPMIEAAANSPVRCTDS